MKNDQLLKLCREIAAELSAADFPHLWRVKRNHHDAWYQTLTTTGAFIDIQNGRDKNRLNIQATRPREMFNAYNAPEITVSQDRTPEAIARDIATRLLPEAREYFKKCHTISKTEKERRATHAAMLHKLQSFTTWKRTDSNGHRTEWQGTRARADIYTETISELRISSPTMGETLKILQILSETRKEETI
jgi:hypothetical protein